MTSTRSLPLFLRSPAYLRHLWQAPLLLYTVLTAPSCDVAITNTRSLPLLLRTLCMCIMAIDRVNVKIIPLNVRACTQTD